MIGGVFASKDLVEMIELPDHPFFVASQFHPEFKSRPTRPAPLFRDFVGAAVERRAGARRGAAAGASAELPPSRRRCPAPSPPTPSACSCAWPRS